MLLYLILPIITVVILLYLIVEFSFLIPAPNGIAVLLYHKVSEEASDKYTVTTGQLEQQFRYIQEKGYKVISFEDLKQYTERGTKLPEKPVIITLDDGYLNSYRLVLPLLQSYKYKATLFIPSAYIGKTNEWDYGEEPILKADILREVSESGLVDIGLHSYAHTNYETLTLTEIDSDLAKSIDVLKSESVRYINVLAYPYGKFPMKDIDRSKAFKAILKKHNIDFGLRIGSKLNKYPIKDRFEMTRTNIKGSESFLTFRIKLKKGRAKLFK